MELDLSVVQNVTLRRLYECYFGAEVSANLHELCAEQGWEPNQFWKFVDLITARGLIAEYAMGGLYIIRTMGIVFAEQNGLVPVDLQNKNRLIRTMILEKLRTLYEESDTAYADIQLSSLVEQLGMDEQQIVMNLQWLEDIGHVDNVGGGSFRLSPEGLFAAQHHRERADLAKEFERIKELKPQPRGRALQKVLAKVFDENGWAQEEGVRTSHEEMDIILHKGREYYLTECKWEKEAIEAGVVRELKGKLDNRVGVQGLLISMSGFTAGAIDQVKSFASSSVILFFGPNDVRSLAYQSAEFEELLDQKYQQFITRRNVIFD